MERGKRRIRLRPPSPAMIVACIALFIALGGTSYAATKLSANCVGTKQIKKSAVTNVKVKKATLTAAKIKDGTLTGAKIKDGTVAAAELASGAVGTTKIGTIPGARVKRTTPLTLTSGISAWVSWEAVDYNVGGVFDSTKPTRMTAPIAGRYLIIVNVVWDTNVTGRRALGVEVNGDSTKVIARSNASAYVQGGMNFYVVETAEAMYALNAGDYVEVFAHQDSGGDLNLQPGVDNAVNYSMQWIAP